MGLEKTTEVDETSKKRWYDDACGTALALELVGERWSLLIVRELMFGPRRFGELRGGLPGISANVLTQRLEGLERAGILARERLPSPANAQVYALTPWGKESETAIQELGRWAVRSPAHDPTLPLSAASIMMSFRTMLDRDAARGTPLRATIRLGDEPFALTIADGTVEIVRGETDTPDFTLATDPMTLAALVYGGMPMAAAEETGSARLSGNPAAFARFAALFVLPPKIGAND